jgi:hypothetical protein
VIDFFLTTASRAGQFRDRDGLTECAGARQQQSRHKTQMDSQSRTSQGHAFHDVSGNRPEMKMRVMTRRACMHLPDM